MLDVLLIEYPSEWSSGRSDQTEAGVAEAGSRQIGAGM